jgi:hypothetical protein
LYFFLSENNVKLIQRGLKYSWGDVWLWKKPLITVQTREKQNKWRNVAAQYARRWETLEADLASDGAGSYKRHAVSSSLSGAAQLRDTINHRRGLSISHHSKCLRRAGSILYPMSACCFSPSDSEHFLVKFRRLLQWKLRNRLKIQLRTPRYSKICRSPS